MRSESDCSYAHGKSIRLRPRRQEALTHNKEHLKRRQRSEQMHGVHIREVALRLTGWQQGNGRLDSHISRSDVLIGRSLSTQPTVVVAALAVALWQVTVQQLKVPAQGRGPKLEHKRCSSTSAHRCVRGSVIGRAPNRLK